MKRIRNIWFLLLVVLFTTQEAWAQVLPDPAWPTDSVTENSIHRYRVLGDTVYRGNPSTFVWVVDGGTLYSDANGTVLAGDGYSASVLADSATNISTLWVRWDKTPTTPDEGYVYAYEITADGCVRPATDQSKYVGMNLMIFDPPIATFLEGEGNVCSYEGTYSMVVKFTGLKPLEFTYSVDGVDSTLILTEEDLSDYDGDGVADNLMITVNGFENTFVETIKAIVIERIVSDGVEGSTGTHGSFNLTIHPQLEPPQLIAAIDTQVTIGTSHYYRMVENSAYQEYHWTLYNNQLDTIYNTHTGTVDSVEIVFADTLTPGEYYLVGQYRDIWGCLSQGDTLEIDVFDLPTIRFVSDSIEGACSAIFFDPGEGPWVNSFEEIFEFDIAYEGAMPYTFTYYVLDTVGVVAQGDVTIADTTDRTVRIQIPNTFVNDGEPAIIRSWTVVIRHGHNYEAIEIRVIDSDVPGGDDERKIFVYPKPFIQGRIDFEN